MQVRKRGKNRIAIIGGGLCGLTCAIRLAEYDFDIDIFEAAPTPGGRTRSFFDTRIHQWVDNGPHLLAGAYRHTQRLLQEAGADRYIHWQPSLELPLWDARRGHFLLAPNRHVPFALAMPWACLRLPGHHTGSAIALLHLAIANRKSVGDAGIDDHATVHDWFRKLNMPEAIVRDLLEPLCLGIMNESMQTANAKSFSRVLREAFDSHTSARLGWFTRPLSKAMIEPLVQMTKSHGIRIHTSTRIRKLNIQNKHVHIDTGGTRKAYDIAVLALPLRARNRLLNKDTGETATRCITNIHLWMKASALPNPLVGGIGTTGQWFFDVSQQMQEQSPSPCRHLCAVISADPHHISRQQCIAEVCRNLQSITDGKNPIQPVHIRMVREFHATAQVRPRIMDTHIPERMIDAAEAPLPGEFPATIEAAVIRGEKAANQCRFILNS